MVIWTEVGEGGTMVEAISKMGMWADQKYTYKYSYAAESSENCFKSNSAMDLLLTKELINLLSLRLFFH